MRGVRAPAGLRSLPSAIAVVTARPGRATTCELAAGDRIAQLVVVPCAPAEPVELELLTDSARGSGRIRLQRRIGFGCACPLLVISLIAPCTVATPSKCVARSRSSRRLAIAVYKDERQRIFEVTGERKRPVKQRTRLLGTPLL
jgi:hypothetical protein